MNVQRTVISRKEPHDEVSYALSSVVWPFVSLGVPVVFNESEHIDHHETNVVNDIEHETFPRTQVDEAVCSRNFSVGISAVDEHRIDWVESLVEFFEAIRNLVDIARGPVLDGVSQVVSEVGEVLVAFVGVRSLGKGRKTSIEESPEAVVVVDKLPDWVVLL